RQSRVVPSLNSRDGVGPVSARAGQLGWPFVATFKEGRTPALWQEYRALLQASPQNRLRRAGGDGRVQEFRWVERLDYRDSEGRDWQLAALEGSERTAGGEGEGFAWRTRLAGGERAGGGFGGRLRTRGSTGRRTAA